MLRPFLYLAGGILALQVAWVLVVPAFGGIDEVDHAYRAASVARGHWIPQNGTPAFGRGDLVLVPEDIVKAANNRCAILPYTGPDNCLPMTEPDRNGEVLVASAAGRYNPAYYWLVGTVAEPFTAANALYVMRFATMALCDVFIFLSLWICLKTLRTRWPLAALLTSLTPTLLYATTVAAPNGVQYAASILMWVAGFALVRRSGPLLDRFLLWSFAGAIAVVIATHTTGPLWALLATSTLMLLPETRQRLVHLSKNARLTVAQSAAAVSVVCAASLWWTLTEKTNLSGGDDAHLGSGVPILRLITAAPLWVFQAIGAIPFRDQQISPLAYATALVVYIGILAIAFAHASSRIRLVMTIIAFGSFAVPMALTALQYSSAGFAWQGRYTFPYALGLLILCGWALDQRSRSSQRAKMFIPVAVLAFGVVQGSALAWVLRDQSTRWPWPSSYSWPQPNDTLWIAASLVATTLCWAGVRLSVGQDQPEIAAPVPTPATPIRALANGSDSRASES